MSPKKTTTKDVATPSGEKQRVERATIRALRHLCKEWGVSPKEVVDYMQLRIRRLDEKRRAANQQQRENMH